MSQRTAVIDLGSNSIKMTVSEKTGDNDFITLKKFREAVRLGQGMSEDNILSEASARRAALAMIQLVKYAENMQCDKIFAVATAALRRAKNKDVFLKYINGLNVNFKILSEHEEAYYGFKGVDAKAEYDNYIILDVGGGSSEITCVCNHEIVHTKSIPYGAVVLSERVPEENMEDFIENVISEIDFLTNYNDLNIIGLGGTADVLCCIADKKMLSVGDIDNVYKTVKNTPPKDRKNINGVPGDRGDIILAGIAIIRAVTRTVSAKSFEACKRGIRDGILREGCI